MAGSDSAAAEQGIFEGGPPNKILRGLHILRTGTPRAEQRAALVIAIAWVPLVFLSLAHGDFLRGGTVEGFLPDFGAQARFLIAAPFLILAESVCLPRLDSIARQFVSTGVLATEDYPSFERAVCSTRRLMNSTAVEVITVAFAYLCLASLFFMTPAQILPRWHGSIVGKVFVIAPAGWWALLVSLPLLLTLLLGWLWRLYIWTRFLWLMRGSKLRLVAAHPDHAGGLKFVQGSLRAFLPLAFVLGVLVAGPTLNLVVHQGSPPSQFKFVVVETVLVAMALFIGPLLVFMHRLLEEQRRGMLLYGGLAAAMGRQFETRWFVSERHLDQSALAASDFSSTTDLYSIVSNVYTMRVLPLEARNVVFLVAATLLPFLPLLFLSVPLDVVVNKLAGLFF